MCVCNVRKGRSPNAKTAIVERKPPSSSYRVDRPLVNAVRSHLRAASVHSYPARSPLIIVSLQTPQVNQVCVNLSGHGNCWGSILDARLQDNTPNSKKYSILELCSFDIQPHPPQMSSFFLCPAKHFCPGPLKVCVIWIHLVARLRVAPLVQVPSINPLSEKSIQGNIFCPDSRCGNI